MIRLIKYSSRAVFQILYFFNPFSLMELPE